MDRRAWQLDDEGSPGKRIFVIDVFVGLSQLRKKRFEMTEMNTASTQPIENVY